MLPAKDGHVIKEQKSQLQEVIRQPKRNKRRDDTGRV